MTQTILPTIVYGDMLKEADVSRLLCQSVRTLQKWRVTGEGPSYFKIGRSVRYSHSEVLAWRDARRCHHTSQYLSP
ncbi:MAG: putative DNA-binding transcriptional regulator AlpA [Reinekea sp.]|jgi:predicted DNA-binding transcriptional regulator AlpA